MQNPWLAIPLSDYEGHMSLPAIGQARMLADELESLLRAYSPRSVAVLGCAGGNGFDRIDPGVTHRVVGVDINPDFVEQTRARFTGRFRELDLYAADIQHAELRFDPVDLMFAGLVFEFVDLSVALPNVLPRIASEGILAAVVQLASPELPAVSTSPFRSLQSVAPLFRYVTPERLQENVEAAGFVQVSSRCIELPSGKRFHAQVFRAAR